MPAAQHRRLAAAVCVYLLTERGICVCVRLACKADFIRPVCFSWISNLTEWGLRGGLRGGQIQPLKAGWPNRHHAGSFPIPLNLIRLPIMHASIPALTTCAERKEPLFSAARAPRSSRAAWWLAGAFPQVADLIGFPGGKIRHAAATQVRMPIYNQHPRFANRVPVLRSSKH